MKTHRNAVFALALFVVLAGVACTRPPVETPPDTVGTLAKPKWLSQEPLIIVGNWDSMPIFRRRVGGNPVWQEDDYRKEHEEETVLKLKELGVTMAVIHFYKGFGLAAEKEHMEDSRKLAALCKKHGLRVGVYIGSTVGYETFLREKPDAESWFVPPYLGRPIFYSGQPFRKRVYFMHPGFREYMKRVLRIAIQDMKVDLIHFDNTSNRAQIPIFFHPQAIEDFRAFLGKKYTVEQLKQRIGFSEVTYIDPPVFDRPVRTIDDPIAQEWADFRCQQLADFYGEMERYIRRLNPEVAVENNPHLGISGTNTVWEQGVDYPRLLAHTDVVWTEEGNEAGVSPEGVLVSKIRSYKMAATLNNSIFTYTGGTGRGGKVAMAEAMAYNRRNLGMVGGMLAGYQLPEDQRNYIHFYKSNFNAFYRDAESRADVAVLHSFASMAYNNDRPWQSSMLFEQALIQAKVPFDIVFDGQLEDLSKYRALVLPDQECLGDTQLRLIRAFVEDGGGLVATEHSSLYTEQRQRRRDFGLQDVLKVSAAEWRGARSEEGLLDTAPVRSQHGKGRVVYIPDVKPAVEKPPAAPMTSRYWKLPANWRDLISAVRWAAGDSFSIEVKAPLTVTAELMAQPNQSRLLVHLVNYDAERNPKVTGIEVSLSVPEGKKLGQAMMLSPDEEKPLPMPVSMRGGRAVIVVPRLQTYGLIVAPIMQ